MNREELERDNSRILRPFFNRLQVYITHREVANKLFGEEYIEALESDLEYSCQIELELLTGLRMTETSSLREQIMYHSSLRKLIRLRKEDMYRDLYDLVYLKAYEIKQCHNISQDDLKSAVPKVKSMILPLDKKNLQDILEERYG